MNLNETATRIYEVLKNLESLLIIIKGSPDPDSIASSFALLRLCRMQGLRAEIIAMAPPSLPQNRAIIRDLHIPLLTVKTTPGTGGWGAYAVLDHQSAEVKGVSGKIPCALHIDHHEKSVGETPVSFSVNSTDAGSVSTIMALVFRELGAPLADAEGMRLATALQLGIMTDTGNLAHASDLDRQALAYLADYLDREALSRLSGISAYRQTLGLLDTAVGNGESYRDWFITGIGFINETSRDSIAILADMLLEREYGTTVVVFAAVEKNGGRGLTLDASFRTKNETLDLNGFIKEITADGGASRFKGAYQVTMDYFAACPAKDDLWNVIRSTTHEIVKKKRDSIRIIELKGVYNRIRSRIRDIFK
jgi:nanoRNase/pAp phosphatase (c-di-AMP/oligoRNAs hydrolase)